MAVTGRMALLHAHAAAMDVDVMWGDLGRRHGLYLHDAGVIVINEGLTAAQSTTALAHEVGHAVHCDLSSTPWVEERADQTGASLIITPDEYSRAEREVGHHAGAIAASLGVAPRTVLAWRRWAARKLLGGVQ